MRSRTVLVLAALAGAVFVLLPLGGGALAATSNGANGDIAFVRGGSLYLVSGGATALVAGATDPSWSPDGTKLAFSLGGAIDTCVVSSCAPAQVGTATGTEPVWSPDGTKIAFVNGANISTVPAAGGTITSVVAGIDPSWNPSDSTQIAFSNGGSIYTCAVASCSVGTPIATGIQPAWSPDGTTIAYESGGSVFVIPAGGGTSNTVAVGAAPNWSPHGDSIVFAAAAGITIATGSGSSWTLSPVTLTAGDSTPDRQTIAPIAAGAPVIFGAAQSGQLLSTDNGTWNGADPTRFPYTYQWLRCDSAGNNCTTTVGTSSTYAVASADVGHTLRLVVTANNAAGSTASAQSSATAVVTTGAAVPPLNTSYPVITLPVGRTAPDIGDTLSVSNGTWTGSFPMTFTYQWKKCDSPTGSCFAIPGATRNTFTVTTDLYGMTIRAEVAATNSAGAVAQNSESTKFVTAIAPLSRATPQITGTVMVGQTLGLTAGTWDGSLPLTFTYSWRRCNPPGDLTSCVQIPGATTGTYIPVVADIGQTIRVWITATNPAGSDTAVTNHTFPVVDKPHFAPTASAAPLIVGTLEVGSILTASIGTFTGDAPIATTQQWQRCNAVGGACKDIKGATKQTYHPTSSDVGSTLRLVVTASNLYGTTTSPSDMTEPVIPQLPHIKGETIIGSNKADYLIGTLHDDKIRGNGGNDTINGDGGYDTIDGGSGNDVINVAGPGKSHVNGGPGSDTIYATNGEKDTIDCGSGQDRAVIDPFDIVHNCEVAQVGNNSGSSSGN
jgi:hypothetical protein